jgi:hypothetical protein
VAKLGDFKTPTGSSGNIFNVGDWLSLVIGAIVLIITFAMGQNVANKLGKKLPVDTTIDQPWANPVQPTKGKEKVVL